MKKKKKTTNNHQKRNERLFCTIKIKFGGREISFVFTFLGISLAQSTIYFYLQNI